MEGNRVVIPAFVDSMRSQGMRRLAAVSVYDDLLRRRVWWCALATRLEVDTLVVSLRLWWPWLLVPFSAPLLWLWAWWRTRRGLEKLQIPMRVVKVRVGFRMKRPKRK